MSAALLNVMSSRVTVPPTLVRSKPYSLSAFPALLTVRSVSDGDSVLARLMPWLELLLIVPPPASGLPSPSPVTTRFPEVPVLLTTMPLGAPLAEMLRKVRSSAWIVVFWTLMAVPVVVVSVLFGAVAPLVSVTAMVPPPVALKAVLAPVDAVMPPSKRTVAPVLPVRLMPVPLSVIEPVEVDGVAGAVGHVHGSSAAGRGDGAVVGDRWRCRRRGRSRRRRPR